MREGRRCERRSEGEGGWGEEEGGRVGGIGRRKSERRGVRRGKGLRGNSIIFFSYFF